MNKRFVFFAVVSLFCISGQKARAEDQEVAMTRCTPAPKECKSEEKGCEHTQQQKWGKEQQGRPMKSAARKVVEGDTSQSDHCKSAARKVIEAEMMH